MAIFKKQRLEELAFIHGETRLVDCLDHQNSLHLQPEHFQQLKTLLRPNSRTDGELQESLIESALMEYFHPEIYLGSSNGESTHQAQLMRDILLWGLENPNNAIKLDDLYAIIFASRSSLVQNCRSTFGMVPMSLMRKHTAWTSAACPQSSRDPKKHRSHISAQHLSPLRLPKS